MLKFDETIQQKQINLQVGRVIQLDAKILDDALISAFRVALRDGLRDGEICLPFSNWLFDFLETHKDSLLKLSYHLMHAFTGFLMHLMWSWARSCHFRLHRPQHFIGITAQTKACKK